MSAPYDDSTQKDWKERKGKIEGFYREMGQVGTPGKENRTYQALDLLGWHRQLRFDKTN